MADRTITTRMRVEYKQAVDGLNAVGQAAGKASDQIDDAGKKLTVAEKSQARAVAAAERRASQSQTAFQKMSKQAAENEQAWNTAGTALTVFGGSITAVGAAALKTGIEYNTLQQTSRAAMKTLMGGAKEANAQMDKLDEFAKKSPFAKQVFIQAQQQLIGFGMSAEKVLPTLDAIQNAVAATGGGNQQIKEVVETMAKIQSASKITGQDLIEFGNRGIDAAGLIGSQMGKTGAQIREDITAGALGADQALDALTKGMDQKFGGAAANVKNTFEGALDRVKSAWRDLSASLAEPLVGKNGGGFAVAGLNALADAMRNFEKLPTPIKATGAALTGTVGAASLAAGGFLLMVPRIVETQKAFATLAGQDDLVGKVAQGMTKLKGPMLAIAKIGGTAAVLGGITVAIAKLVEGNQLAQAQQGTKDVASAIEAMRTSSDGLDKIFQKRDGSALTGDIDSLGAALDRTFNRSWDERFNDWGESFLQPITGLRGQSGMLADSWAALDTELAKLVDSGKPEQAAAAFEKIKERAVEQGHSVEELNTLFPEYEKSVTAAGDAASAGAEKIGEISPQAVAAQKHIEEVKNQLTESADGFLNFSEKATDAKVSLQQWIDDMGKQVEAQEQWFDNLGELMQRGAPQEFIDFLMSLGPEGAKRVKQLADASDTELQRAIDKFTEGKNAAGKFAEEVLGIPDVDLDADASKLKDQVATAKERLDELRKLPTTPEIDAQITLLEEKVKQGRKKLDDLEKKKTEPKIDADTKPAKSDVEAFDKWLEERKNPLINIDAKVRIINEGQIRNMPETLLNPNRKQVRAPGVEKKASGGPIFGPGSGTSDDIPAWLSNGEHVWTAEEVRKAGGHSVIEAMRQAAKSGMLGFAKGGAVGAAERRVDSANTSLKSARRRKQDARSKAAKAAATRAVRAAEDELASARKSLKSAKDKAAADSKAARLAAQQAKEAKREAERRAKEERERRARVGDMRTDLRTDIRRGSIRDSVTSGLSGGLSQVDQLFGYGKNKDLSRGSRSRANSSARKFEANLTKLYAQAERIDERLKKAQDKAQELKGIKDSVVNSLLGGRDLDVGTYQTRDASGAWSSHSNLGQAAKGLRVDVGAMKSFAGKLKKLTELGVPGQIIQQIAQAGPVEGSNMADSFIDATAAERKSYLGAWSDYEKYANQAGQYVTEGFHKGGSAAADGVVKGLEGKQKNVEAAIANLAKTMESTFKTVLGIHSPSRVMADLGGFTAEGLVQGMLGGVSDVQSAAAALGSAAVPNMMAFAPSDMSMDVGVSPVVSDDEGMAGLAMQDMSTTTLEAMQAMGLAVSDGFAGMLANTQAAQSQMLLDTQLNQTGMLTATQAANLGQLTDTQVQHAAMLLNTQTQNAAMLLDTQTQQEAMRANVLAKQTGQRTAATEQQEAMRLMLIDKQSQMKTKSATDFEELKNTTGSKFTSMRTNTDTTMGGIYSDYDTRLADLKGLNKRGFESILSTSVKNMEGVRDGIDGQMAAAKPELGNRLNSLIGVLSKFTESVNKAFGDVGVKLKAPQSLSFATGGVLPGYTPGRDVHEFYSPTAGYLNLSGGEAIMRPEFVRAVGGRKGIDELNKQASGGHLQHETDHFATGGVIPEFSFANGGTLIDAANWWVRKGARGSRHPAFGGAVRSGHSRNSLHYQDRAVDLNYGPGGTNAIEQAFFDKWIGQFKGSFPGIRTIWRAPGHFNHLHIDTGNGADIGNFAGALAAGEMSHPFLDRAKVSSSGNLTKAYERAAKKLTSQIYAKHAKDLPDGIAGQLGRGIMSNASEGLISKAKEYGKTTAVSGSTAGDPAVKAAVRKIAEQMGWDKYWGDIDWLVNKESSWNPKAANPSSSARGLFQKMTSLHGPVEDTVEGQARWGLNYIKSTYGNPAAARRHHERSNWYEQGSANAKSGWAVVGENGPELIQLAGGERVQNASDTRKLLAENRTFIPNQGSGFDQSALVDAVSSAIQSGGVSAESLAAAFDGVRMTFQADGQQFTGAVTAVVGNGYDESRSRLAKASQKIGAR